MAATPTAPANDVTGKTIDLSAEVRKMWGPEWGKAPIAYEFSNGRKFYMRTEDAAIYATSPDF